MMNNESQSIYVGDQQVLLQSDYHNFSNVLINSENSTTGIIVARLVSPKNDIIHSIESRSSVPSNHSVKSLDLEEAIRKDKNTQKDDLVQHRKLKGNTKDDCKDSKAASSSSAALCSMCGKHFSSNFNLKRHMNTCKQCPDNEKRLRFECHCGRTYSQEWDLKKHKSACRNVGKKCKNCLIPDCNLVFYHRSQLLAHMKKDHSLKIQDPEVFDFPSVKEFLLWKEEEEEITGTYYSKQTGSNVTGVSINTYYICQNDGSERLHGSSDRKTERRNKKGRIKTGRVCWSQMNVKEFSEGNVKVTYFPSHTHPVSASDAEHHPLPRSISSEIKRRAADNSDEDGFCSEYPELMKLKKKSYGMNVKTLRALARKNRKLFRITAEAVQDVGSSSKENESRQLPEEVCSEADLQRTAAVNPQEYEQTMKSEFNSSASLLEDCHSAWRQLSGLIESGKLQDSTLAQVHTTLESLLEGCKAEILQSESNTEAVLYEQLPTVMYQNDPLSPDVFPLSEDTKQEIDIKPMDKTVYQVVTIAAKDESASSSPEEILAVEFPREFIIIAKDQILHTINPSQIALS